MNGGFIYLASPYAHADPEVREQRYRDARATCIVLMRQGLCIYSPIVHNHPLAGELPADHDFWMKMDLPILRRADELWVLKIPGWDVSKGVAREIKEATECRMPVRFFTLPVQKR